MAFLQNAESKEEFLKYIGRYFPKNNAQYALIQKAEEKSEELFKGELRLRGEPYIEHARRITIIALALVGVRDANTIAACIMHDNREFAEGKESSSWSSEKIEKEFNYGVEVLVAACTAPRVQWGRTRAEAHKLYHARFGVLARQRILFEVKLPDRLDNLMTISCDIMPRGKVVAKIIETEKHFLPAALRHNILAPEMKAVLEWHRRKLRM